MKQRLGDKKHAACEGISGNRYVACYTRGGWTHGLAECWLADGARSERGGYRDCDLVNYRTGEWWPDYRNGEKVTHG